MRNEKEWGTLQDVQWSAQDARTGGRDAHPTRHLRLGDAWMRQDERVVLEANWNKHGHQ